jgi:hypothetical protein
MDNKLSEIIRSKEKKQTVKKRPDNTHNTDISASNNNVNTGRQKPGSNWKIYRNIIAIEAVANNQASHCIKVRKQGNNFLLINESNKNELQCNGKNQVMTSLNNCWYYPYLLCYHNTL